MTSISKTKMLRDKVVLLQKNVHLYKGITTLVVSKEIADIMARNWTLFVFIVIGILMTRTQTAAENYNGLPTNVIITGNESMKRIEAGITSNFTSNMLLTPAVIQQGSNLFIKPKIILGSPFTSFKQGYNPAQPVSFTSKVTGEETSVVIGKPETPVVATVALPPAMIVPASVHGDVSIVPPRIDIPAHIPIIPSNACPAMTCPPYILPISSNFPHLSIFPTVVEKTVRPVVIPKPPELPPIVLPKLPIEVVIQKPFVPILDHTVIVQSLCPPQVRCFSTEKELPTGPNIFSGVFQNFKNLLNKIDLTTILQSDEQSPPKRPIAYPLFPTMCAQGIITERFVPNIVKKNDINIIISRISTSQLANMDYGKK